MVSLQPTLFPARGCQGVVIGIGRQTQSHEKLYPHKCYGLSNQNQDPDPECRAKICLLGTEIALQEKTLEVKVTT